MANKSFFQELTSYRLKVERDGREVMNIPGILCLPGVLIAPKMSLLGAIAAPILGCNIHLEGENGKEVDIGKTVQQAADTVVDTAKTAAKSFREELNKAWESVSADDPEENAEAEDEPETDASEVTVEEPADDVPTIDVDSDNSTQV